MSDTAGKVKNMFGSKLYQQRAQEALPILVRQAASKSQIFYERLADEMGMPNPRNLDWVLGSVGVTLIELGHRKNWQKRLIPPIQSLVINQAKGLPGHGFDGFLASKANEYRALTTIQKRRYLQSFWNDIFAFPHWQEVLEELGLEANLARFDDEIEQAKSGRGNGGGEGPEHMALKLYVRDTPGAVGIAGSFPSGEIESPLPSGDKIDVLFRRGDDLIGVEVKSKISNNVDIVRGLFQCVKYRAVMEAERGVKSAEYLVDAMLVVGREFPSELDGIRNSLRVRVFEVFL